MAKAPQAKWNAAETASRKKDLSNLAASEQRIGGVTNPLRFVVPRH